MTLFGLFLVVWTVPALAADPPEPKFRHQTIDDKIEIGYGVVAADVDGDGRPDILLADKRQFVWYRNPTWEKFVIAENLTKRDNVCLAAQDLDGDGKCELAVGGDWAPEDRETSGAVFYMIPPADRTQKWDAVKLPAEPTVHRMRWMRPQQGLTPKPLPDPWALAVASLHGRGSDPKAAPKLLLYYKPDDPHAEWRTWDLSSAMERTHNLDIVRPNEVLLAGSKGVRYTAHCGDYIDSKMAAHSPKGAGEVRSAPRSGYIATVEPMHGNELAVYVKDERTLLTDKLVEGHALACGDLLKTDHDQVVVGWRGGGGGVRLFMPTDATFKQWRESVIDDKGMACEDLCLADLNADGKLDIVASGRATKNVKVYWNETASAATQPATTRSAAATQPHLLWQRRHTMRGRHGRMTLLDAVDGGYRVVSSSGFFNPDKSFTELSWMMSLGAGGKQSNVVEYPAKGNEADIHAALAMPGGRTLAIGGMSGWIAPFDAAGAMQPQTKIRAGDFDISTSTAVADRPESLLVGGSRAVSYAEHPPLVDAWLARMTHDGTVLWQKTFDRAHMDMAQAILPLRDGGCVLAINSGKYNKFGGGPTALWLIRCDADGNKVADSIIDGAQINPAGRKYLVPLGDTDAAGVVVSYTVGQIGPSMDFRAHAQAFDANLKPIWQRELSQTTCFGSMLITRTAEGDIAAVGEIKSSPVVIFLDPRDGTVRRQVSLPLDGMFNAGDILARADGIVAVGSYQDRQRLHEPGHDQDVLVFKVR